MVLEDDYTVRLEEVFHGPLDLLLHLVREQEVEIHEIEVHRVIEGYFDYLQNMQNLELEVAGDFLVMAATLMAIKSRSLLPREEVELEDELDPGDELIQRLIEYRRFKSAADGLHERHRERLTVFDRGYKGEVRDLEPEKTYDIGELTAWDVLGTFSRLMRETLAGRTHHIKGDARPLRWFVSELGRSIRAKRRLTLKDVLSDIEETPTKNGMIGAFCALLELMRLGVVTARQGAPGEEIEVHLVEEVEEDLERLIDSSRFMDEDDGLPEESPEPSPGPSQREGGTRALDSPYSPPQSRP